MNIAEIKGTINSTLGTNKFKALSNMISHDTDYPKVLMNAPIGMPSNIVKDCTFTPDNKYLAVIQSQSTTQIILYENQNEIWVSQQIDQIVIGAASGNKCNFSGTGNYLVGTVDTTPFYKIYKYNQGGTPKYIALTGVPVVNYQCFGCAFSPDDQFLALCFYGTPGIKIFQRSGDTFTDLPNIPSLPAGVISLECAFDPTGVYLAITLTVSPYLYIYKRNGTTFTKLPDVSGLPGSSFCVDISYNYIAVGHEGALFFSIFKRNGDVFTQVLTNIPLAIMNTVYGINISNDEKFLYLVSPYSVLVNIYSIINELWLPPPLEAIASGAYGISVSNDNKYLAVGTGNKPFIYTFKNDNFNLINFLEMIYINLIL